MMQGHNRIRWNQATMALAAQHYLDTVLFKTPGKQKVTAVRMVTEPGAGEWCEVLLSTEPDCKSTQGYESTGKL